MKIKILVCMAGTDTVLRPGDVTITDRAEADRLIAAGFAEAAASEETEQPEALAATSAPKRGKK